MISGDVVFDGLLIIIILENNCMDVKSLLSKLILGEITVSQALMLTKSFYSSSVSENSLKWINRECDGYESALLIPDYRLLDCILSIEIYDVFGNLQNIRWIPVI